MGTCTADNHVMQRHPSTKSETASIAAAVRHRIQAGGERIWRLVDFAELPWMAVAQALSRLARQGVIQRLGKGLYYRSRPTVFGASQPNPAMIRSLWVGRQGVFPAGLSAANLLGFTTQNPGREEVATDGGSLPQLIVGRKTIIYTRRPTAWRELPEADAALLDFLRRRGGTSELSPAETVRKLVNHCRERGRFDRLMKVAMSEPPRVRAILGAIGQELGHSPCRLTPLRASLNPLSRFDFGVLSALKHAREWQAKPRRT
jgi:hypothetical protein